MRKRTSAVASRVRLGLPALVFVAALLSASAAFAQSPTLRDKFRTGSEVIVRAGETITDDLYASGGRVIIEGRVQGDVIVAGGEVRIRGAVTDDVLAAGGRVAIGGNVGGDVRAAGGQISLEGSAAQDVLVTGGQLSVSEAARIEGDLVFSGGQMTLDGRVRGDVLGTAGTYQRSGSVGGTEEVRTGPAEAGPPSASDRLLGAVRRYLSVLLLGALFLWLAPRFFETAAGEARGRPLPSLGVGGLAALGLVLGLVALLFVIALASVGLGALGFGSLVAVLAFGALLAAGVASFTFALIVAFVADALVGLAAGRLLLRDRDGASRMEIFGALAAGVAVVVMLTSLPLIGGFLKFVVVLAGLGALLLAIGRRRGARASPTAS